ncbi:peptide synthetase [Penicillium brevicompactum]|uniref:Peptide synthetase n=1 Tax=Penicillium brevicompactum TaxID=5074 RepID=A0A9W9USN6_PENBR|nr:peptide synthetase [Penicillium brevicompactum]
MAIQSHKSDAIQAMCQDFGHYVKGRAEQFSTSITRMADSIAACAYQRRRCPGLAGYLRQLDTWPDSVVLHQNFDRHIEMRVDEDLVCRKTMPMLSSWPVFPVLLATHPGKEKLDALLLISTKFGVQQDVDRMLGHFAAALRRLEEDPGGRMLSNDEPVDINWENTLIESSKSNPFDPTAKSIHRASDSLGL